MDSPYLIINCKTYGARTGELAVRIAHAIVQVQTQRRAQNKKKIVIALAVPATEIHMLASLGLVPVFAEHLDPETPGAHTGKIIAEDILANGAVGSLINHSEDPYELSSIQASVLRATENGLISVVCAKDALVAAQVASFGPSMVAMEPPELIGGPISVSTAHPELISQTVEAVRRVADIPVLVGAGVKTTEDVRVSMSLGAQGVLVASGVTKAENLVAAITELANGF